jgi:hypothetical protein
MFGRPVTARVGSTCSCFARHPPRPNPPPGGGTDRDYQKITRLQIGDSLRYKRPFWVLQNGASVLVGCLTLNCMTESPTVNRAVCGEKLRLSRAVAWALQLACEATMERDRARKEKREQAFIACIEKVRQTRDSARMAVAALEHHCLEHGCDGLAPATRPSEG